MGYSFDMSTSIKQVKGLELILRVPFAFGSCCCEPHHAVKELSIQVKQTIVRLQKQNKSIREIAGTLGVAKSQFGTFWEKEITGELSNIKRHGCPRRTTVVDDRRILSMVNKNPFTRSSQEKNTLQEVDVSLSKSTIKRRLHQSKYRGFTTRCKQGLNTLFQKHKKKKKARPLLEKHSLDSWN